MTSGVRVGIVLVRAYQLALSPFAGGACRFEPSCSAYAIRGDRGTRARRGLWLALRRVARCHPLGSSGHRSRAAARERPLTRRSQPLMEKRVFLAIFLSFVVLAVYQSYFAPPAAGASTGDRASAGRPSAHARHAGAAGHDAGRRRPPRHRAGRPRPRRSSPTVARDIVVETDAVRAVFIDRRRRR